MTQTIQDFNRIYVEKFATAKAVPAAQKRLLALVGSGHKLLDVGCGSGFYTIQFKAQGNDVVATDLTPEGIEATGQLGIETHFANVEEQLPFPEASFDLVTFVEVVEHLVRPDLALREINRVLKPGGHLVLTTPNYAYWVLRILYLFGQPPVGLKPRPFAGWRARQPAENIDPWLDPHIRFFTPQSVRDLLVRSGFKTVALQSTFVAFPSGLAPFLPWLPGLPLRVLGKLIGNLNFLGDWWPSLLAAGMMVKAQKQ